jgi:acetyl esterase/lipase
MDRLDPELRVVVEQIPALDLTDIPAARASLAELYAQINTGGPNPRVSHSDHMAPGRDGNPDVMVRVFRPAAASGPLPCLYWTQGGGYVLTAPDMDDQFCEEIADRHGCVVVSVDWRRAPEHPFPAAAEDCYAGLAWTVTNADTLGIDPGRIVIGGHSPGGGSTAGLALLVRDRGEFTIAHQLLVYPMLDDRTVTREDLDTSEVRVWSPKSNRFGWTSYLGAEPGGEAVEVADEQRRVGLARGPEVAVDAEVQLDAVPAEPGPAPLGELGRFRGLLQPEDAAVERPNLVFRASRDRRRDVLQPPNPHAAMLAGRRSGATVTLAQ